jgi:pimeloyl-ACP methyl ester carboxylesterase
MPLPVLMVHGLASSFEHGWARYGWPDLLADADREVIGVDLLGHGQAPKPHDPAAYANLGERVARARAGYPVVDAVGFSLGAMVLLRLAAAAPASFGRLVLMGVGDRVMRQRPPGRLADVLSGRIQTDEPRLLVLQRLASANGNDPDALAACAARPSEPLTADLLRRVDVPILVILGEQDFNGPALELVGVLPRAELVTIPRLDHFATPGHPLAMERALRYLDAYG